MPLAMLANERPFTVRRTVSIRGASCATSNVGECPISQTYGGVGDETASLAKLTKPESFVPMSKWLRDAGELQQPHRHGGAVVTQYFEACRTSPCSAQSKN